MPSNSVIHVYEHNELLNEPEPWKSLSAGRNHANNQEYWNSTESL